MKRKGTFSIKLGDGAELLSLVGLARCVCVCVCVARRVYTPLPFIFITDIFHALPHRHYSRCLATPKKNALFLNISSVDLIPKGLFRN
jgi:hypothetical protein